MTRRPLLDLPLRGRVEEVQLIVEALRDPRVRSVSLTGLGGVGKTRIAAAVAARIDVETERTVAWVDVSGIAAVELFELAVARVAGITGWDPSNHGGLGVALDGAPRLVVLDGLDLDPDHSGIHDRLHVMLRAARTTQFLITARTPRRFPQDHLVRIDPLGAGESFEELRDHPGVELFVDISTSVGAASPTDDDLAVIANVVDLLGGNPLAIVLAAAHSMTFSPTTLRGLFDRPSPNEMFKSSILHEAGELRASIDSSLDRVDLG